LLVEGPAGNVERLLERLREEFASNIERQALEEVAINEPPDGFEIRR
jgi:hypothetical protein